MAAAVFCCWCVCFVNPLPRGKNEVICPPNRHDRGVNPFFGLGGGGGGARVSLVMFSKYFLSNGFVVPDSAF